MITTGKTMKADKAKKAGLVDLVVDPACLESVAIQQVLCILVSFDFCIDNAHQSIRLIQLIFKMSRFVTYSQSLLF